MRSRTVLLGLASSLVLAAQDPPASTAITLCGRAFDGSHRPIEGAAVAVRLNLPWRHPDRATWRDPPPFRTGRDGRFRITCDPPAGTLALRITAPGCVPAEEAQLPRFSADFGDIELESGALLRGRVVDARGRPVAGFPMTLPIGLGIRKRFPVMARATTDGDGRFAFDAVVPARAHRLQLEREEYRVLSGAVVVQADDLVVDAEVRVAPRPTIAGVVFGTGGRPLAGVDVDVTEPHWPSRTATRPDGSFVLPAHDSAPGSVRLEIGARGAAAVIATPEIRWERAGLRFEVETLHTLPLAVVEHASGVPVEEFGVYVRPYAGATRLDTRIRHDGRPHRGGAADLPALYAGRNRVLVVPCNHALTVAQLFVDAGRHELPRQRVEVERMQWLSIVVLDGAGLPQRAEVDLLDLRGADHILVFEDPRAFLWAFPDDPVAIRLSTTITDADGRGRLLAARPRKGLVFVVRDGGNTRHPFEAWPASGVLELRPRP